MAFQTAAGAILAVSASSPSTFDATGYGALTYTAIGEITNVGAFGKEFALVTHNPLATRGTKKAKGSFNNGQLNPAMALDKSDAGQAIMVAGLDADAPRTFKLTLQDSTVYYMSGLVMKFQPNVAGVDDIVTAETTIELDHNPIVRV